MTTYVYRDGKLVDKNTAPPKRLKHGSGSYVISDEMAETRHMADGKYYTSKVKFRQATRDAGCVEVGNDAAILKPRKPIELDRGARREAIKRTIYDMRNGRR